MYVIQRKKNKSYWWGANNWGDLEFAQVFASEEEVYRQHPVINEFMDSTTRRMYKIMTVKEAEVEEVIDI